ncbi:MAG: hypothetical protein OXI15_18150, partial [Chromatiales bacterium]|nr:hypothetical protein [Chromatiales bacterium]
RYNRFHPQYLIFRWVRTLERGPVTDAGGGILCVIRLLREKTGLEPDLRVEFGVVLTRTRSECESGWPGQ